MGRVTKAAGNVYCKARMEAAKKNDFLNSREGAAEALGMSKDALAKYELDLCKTVPVESVVLMADLYHTPELLNYYCANECPIGRGRIFEVEDKPVEQITLQMISLLRGVDEVKNTLIDIASDGSIDEPDKPKLYDVIEWLDRMIRSVNELKLYAEKHVDKERI